MNPNVKSKASLDIGGIQIPGRLALAPMAGISDVPFRNICRGYGAAMTPTEMITADQRLWHSNKSRHRLAGGDGAGPRIFQIAGSEAGMLATAAQSCVAMGADIIDINMGCPAKKVCRRRAGSALLADEPLVARLLAAVVAAVEVPVTLKMRTGVSPQQRNGVDIAVIAEELGVAAITVHGRTRACMYRGNAEYDTIAAIKSRVSVPVIANGDIDSAEKAARVLRHTGADGLMLGRAVQGRPWLFADIENFLNTGFHKPPPPLCEVRAIILGHLEHLYEFYGEKTGVRVARKHLTWYSSELPGGLAFKNRVVRVESAREQFRITHEFLNNNEIGTHAA
jgi:tRNA-dihydrouridine synthase B